MAGEQQVQNAMVKVRRKLLSPNELPWWIALFLLPLMWWFNGRAVSADQLVIRTLLFGTAIMVGVLRLHIWLAAD